MLNLPKYQLGRIAELEYTEKDQNTVEPYITIISKRKKEKLIRRLLKYLSCNETEYQIGLNDFLTKHLKIDPNNQNEGNKTLVFLRELELLGLIDWDMQPGIPWKKGSRFITLSKHTITASITSKGHSYLNEWVITIRQFLKGFVKYGIGGLTGILVICLMIKELIS